MYISRIWLKNIRGFKELDLDLKEPRKVGRNIIHRPRHRTVIIGENGTCKTTLLRCIAIGLCDQAWGNALVAEDTGELIGRDGNEGTIRIELMFDKGKNSPVSLVTTITRKDRVERVGPKESLPPADVPFVCGYGAGRAVLQAGEKPDYRIIDAVYTLFRYDTPLSDPELILYRLRDYLGTNLYGKIMPGIKKAIGLHEKDEIEPKKGGGIEVRGPTVGGRIPLQGWADGYRLTFTWIVDLYGKALNARSLTKAGGVRGIILVDELEQHLHPSLHGSLLPRISELVPDAQLIATTHSPLVTLGATANEIVSLKRFGQHIRTVHEKPDLTGFSAEDVLTQESYFDTRPYSPTISKKLREYEELAKVPRVRRSSRQKAKLAKLAKELAAEQVPLPNTSPLMLEIRRLQKVLSLRTDSDD